MTAALTASASTLAPLQPEPHADADPQERRPSLRLPAWLGGASAVLWVASLLQIRLDGMTDVGLVSVLPLTFYAALACLVLSFCMLVRSPARRERILAGQVAGLILIVHGTPTILYGTLRYAWAWKHVGVVDYIQRHGTVDPNTAYLSVYHNWPGFFGLSALLTQMAGLKSALSFAAWGPVFFNLIFVAAVVLIVGSLTTDRRLVWMAGWIFVLTNWIGQDYFSPQALNYFLYLVIIGICLRWLRTESPAGARQRMALVGLIVLLMATDVSSHQLTPIMLIAGLTALVAWRQIRPRHLPLVMIILTVGWMVTGAATFVRGNIPELIRSLGQLESNTGANLINLAKGSRGQATVAMFDRLLTAAVLVTALAGCGVRRLRLGRWDLPAMLLLASPVPLLAVNDYGGEMLFRVYFFALPFAAFFAACLVFPRSQSRSNRLRTAVSVILSMSLLTCLLFVYYGKERMYHFTHDEVAASSYVYDIARPGSLIVSITANHPWPSRNYEQYKYLWLGLEDTAFRTKLLKDPKVVVGDILSDPDNRAAYLVITDSQIAEVNMTGLLPRGSVEKLEAALGASPNFTKIYNGPHARVWMTTVEAKRSR